MATSKVNLSPFDPSAGLADKRIPLVDVAKQVSKRINVKLPALNAISNALSYKEILKFAWVPAHKIYINYIRQRWPEPGHQKNLLEKWNLACVTPLTCRYDPVEDRYYGSDGQQHMTVWLMKYGLLSEVPCFYIESTDPNIESIQLLSLNTLRQPMAKYFIHKQEIIMGDPDAIAMEKAVTDANCETAYKKRSPGCVTHISHLTEAYEDYGTASLNLVLSKLTQFWPRDKIETPTMLGFLKVLQLMRASKQIPEKEFDSIFNDLFYHCSNRYENSKDLHASIHRAFVVSEDYKTNYKGLGHREQVASGIIDIYEQESGKKLAGVKQPFAITIPLIPKEELVQEEDLEMEDA
jgi:hypothetical protein